jgi:hypothetical protein
MEEVKPGLWARVKGWPLWAKVVAVVVVLWLVVNVALFVASVVAGQAVKRQFDDIQEQVDP